jgi:hypothetical protein
MQGREFLELARELVALGTHARHWRAVVIHAYYALLLECRDVMTRWGLPPLTRQQVHAQVRLRMVFATNQEIKNTGLTLEELSKHRNAANYDLRALPMFASVVDAKIDIQDAADALASLDAIDADPVRRSAAIASIRP